MHYSQFFQPLLAIGALLPAMANAEVSQSKPSTEISDQQSMALPERCRTNPCEGITFKDPEYVCGDSRLGPVELPRRFPLQTELRTYARFGNLCPVEYLKKWADSEGSYIYPPSNGFVVDTENQPILGNASLPVGQKLDRFGSEHGTFLAPLGAPYIERSLPPSNLKTYDGNYPYNYHVYEVTKSFVAGLGPVAPWFEQPGMGSQIVVYRPVMDLLADGYLRRLDRCQYDEAREYADNYTKGPEDSKQ